MELWKNVMGKSSVAEINYSMYTLHRADQIHILLLGVMKANNQTNQNMEVRLKKKVTIDKASLEHEMEL